MIHVRGLVADQSVLSNSMI